MATQEELAAQLREDSAKIQKIATETRTLIDNTTALLAQIEELKKNQTVSPDLQSAADDVKTQLQVVDDLVPDAPPGP